MISDLAFTEIMANLVYLFPLTDFVVLIGNQKHYGTDAIIGVTLVTF